VKEIPLTGKHGRGRVALIDDEDYDLAARYRWYAKVVDSKIYAATSHSGASGVPKRPICMHVLLTGYDLTDHRNGDGLDNRHENLRVATQAQNLMNRGCPSNNTSGFKGVSQKRDKWVAGIRAGNVVRKIGGFATAEAAARAYDAMAIELHGEFAWLNFPDDPAREIPPPPVQYCTRPDCGKEYAGRRSNSRYCSQRCADVMHYRRKLEVQVGEQSVA
jgi:hypothetical protein